MTLKTASTALLITLFAFGVSFAGASDYMGGLSRFSNEAVSLYFLVAVTAILSFIVVLISPTAGIILAMLLFPFVTQDASMTLPKMLASIVLFGFFVAWVAGKIASTKDGRREKDYLGTERSLILFFLYLLVNGGYAVVNGIAPLDFVRDLIPISSLIIFLIAKRFTKNVKSLVLLEKVQFALMGIFTLEFALLTFTRLRIYAYLPVSMSALQILGLFFVSMLGLMQFKSSKRLLLVTAGISIIYLISTNNRTQFIAALLGLSFALIVTKITRGKLIAVFIGIVLFSSAFLIVQQYAPAEIERKTAKLHEMSDLKSDLSAQDRIGEAEQCYQLFLSNPIMGVGAGYTYHLYRHYRAGLSNVVAVTNFTHADIMYLLSKIGLAGLVFFLWFYYKISKLAWLTWKKAPDSDVRTKGLICFLILITALIIGQSTPVLQTRSDTFFLSLVMGYTYCLYRFYVALPAKEKARAEDEEAALALPSNLTPAYGHPSPAGRGGMYQYRHNS